MKPCRELTHAETHLAHSPVSRERYGQWVPARILLQVDVIPGRVGTSGSAIAWTLLIIVIASAAPIEGLEQPDQEEPVTAIYLVSHGWHTEIVIKRVELPVSLRNAGISQRRNTWNLARGDQEFLPGAGVFLGSRPQSGVHVGRKRAACDRLWR